MRYAKVLTLVRRLEAVVVVLAAAAALAAVLHHTLADYEPTCGHPTHHGNHTHE